MRRRLVPRKAHVESIQREPEIVRVEAAARFVTLDDPAAPLTLVRGAFVRLQPPEGMPPDAVAAWRDAVAREARAVRVVAAVRSAAVALASVRTAAEERVGSIRQEALALAEETGDADVVSMVRSTLDEVGAR